MAFVLDASMSMTWCFADEGAPFSRSVLVELRDTYAEVPAIWSMEVANVLAMGERRRRISLEQSTAFQLMLDMSDIRVEPLLLAGELSELLTLCRKHRLTAYDAAYLDLASANDYRLLRWIRTCCGPLPVKASRFLDGLRRRVKRYAGGDGNEVGVSATFNANGSLRVTVVP